MFSQLEIKVLTHKALARVGDSGAGLQLLKLAQGLFRLDEVEAFALKDINERIKTIVRSDKSTHEKGRQLLLMDQIEVRLSYRVNRYGSSMRRRRPSGNTSIPRVYRAKCGSCRSMMRRFEGGDC